MIVERTPVQSGWPLLLEYRKIRENKDPVSHPLDYGLTFQQRFSGSRRSPASKSRASDANLILNGIKNDTTHLDPEGKVQIYGRVAYIDIFKINKPYRNNGLGSKAMSDLIDFLSKLYVDFALIKPFPLEDEGISKEGIKKLIAFYKRFGFEITDEYRY